MLSCMRAWILRGSINMTFKGILVRLKRPETGVRLSLHLLCWVPFLEILYQVQLLSQGSAMARWTADPGKSLHEELATIGLWLLLISLTMTPIKLVTGWAKPIQYRRLWGLYSFFYLSLHVLAFWAFILERDIAALGGEILKRPYLIVGFLAWFGLLLMAATSYKAAMRRLGKRWKLLHQWVYVLAILGVWHEWWQAKEAWREPALHILLLVLLLSIRLYFFLTKRRKRQKSAAVHLA